jgi:hypothetical protein
MTRGERIEYYRRHIYAAVEGWLRYEICDVVAAIGVVHERHDVNGDIVEFGVHHGKFLLLIDALREPGERTIAVDLFDAQELSPHDPDEERENYLRLTQNIEMVPWPTRSLEIMKADTLRLRRDYFSKVKLFSVDAGHTPLNAFNDLVIAQEALVPGGIIAFDDFFCPCWPGATEGVYKFMAQANRRLKPLLFHKGKLFLTTASEQRALLSEYRDLLTPLYPQAVIKDICGYECLVMSWDGY